MTTPMTTKTAAPVAPPRRLSFDPWKAGMVVMMVFALGISIYMSYVKVLNVPMTCSPNPAFDCGTVQQSIYSMFLGVPVAVWGLLLNITIIGTLLLENRIPLLQEQGPVISFGLILFAALFSIWLIYVQGTLLNAWCPWCLSHEAAIFGVFIASIPRLVKHMQAEQQFSEELPA